MNKKAIVILGAIFLLIVGTLGFLVYSKYSSKKPTPVAQTTPQPSPSPVVTPSSTPPANPGLVKLTSDQVVSPTLFYSGTGVTYFDNQGNLYQASLQDNNGQLGLADKKKVDIPVKPGIAKILWPPKTEDFMAQYTDASGRLVWTYFNSHTASFTDLPPQVTSVDWMPSGTQIMYVWLDNNKASLSLANPDTKNFKKLTDLWETDDSIHISPDGSQLLYYETNNSGGSNAINSVTADGKVFKGLVKSGQNFGVVWSPDGQKFLFAKKDQASQKFQLWYYNLTSGAVEPLGLFTTTEKAVWDKDSNVIYAAVPTVGTAGGNSLTVDSFVRLDTTTLNKQQYSATANQNVDGRDLFLNPAGDKLFFRNAQDGGLYYLDLTQQ